MFREIILTPHRGWPISRVDRRHLRQHLWTGPDDHRPPIWQVPIGCTAGVIAMGNVKKLSADGPPCPRCKQPTEVREHIEVTAKELAQPYYYSRWYRCANSRCRTGLIMPHEFRVVREHEYEPSLSAIRMRQTRKRRRDGLRCLRIELRETEVDALVDNGLLNPDARNNRSAVLNALYSFLEQRLDPQV
jgi:hypothetical protein